MYCTLGNLNAIGYCQWCTLCVRTVAAAAAVVNIVVFHVVRGKLSFEYELFVKVYYAAQVNFFECSPSYILYIHDIPAVAVRLFETNIYNRLKIDATRNPT